MPQMLDGLQPLVIFTVDQVYPGGSLLDPRLTLSGDSWLQNMMVKVTGLMWDDKVTLLDGPIVDWFISFKVLGNDLYYIPDTPSSYDGSIPPRATVTQGENGTLTIDFGINFSGSFLGSHAEAILERLLFTSTVDSPSEYRTLQISMMDRSGVPGFAPRTGTANPLDGIDASDRSLPALTDLDGDGRVDLVSGAFDGTLRVWRNTPTGLVQLTGAANPLGAIDVGEVSAPAFVDFDRDGDADLVVGAADGKLRAWRNDHGVFKELTGSANPFAGIAVFDVSAPAFFDLDRDGRLDLVVGTGDGTLAVWRSTVGGWQALTGQYNPFRNVDVGFNSVPALTDLDLDGDADLLVGDAFGKIRVWRNEGVVNGFVELAGGANPFAAVDLGQLSAPSFGDVNGDGDPDLVIGERFGTFAVWDNGLMFGRQVTVIVRDPYPKVTGLVDAVTFEENAVNAAPRLLDADVTFSAPERSFAGGRLVLSGWPAEDRLSILPSGTGAGQIGVSDGTVTYGGVEIGSVSGGVGGPLVVAFNAAATAPAVEALIERLAYANASETPAETRTLTLDVVDADGVRLNAPVTPVFTHVPFSQSPFADTTLVFSVASQARGMVPALGDVDGDGDLDLVVGSSDGGLAVWRNVDGGRFERLTDAANPFDGVDVGSGSAPAFIDFDADGRLDLVVGDAGGLVAAFRNTGSGFVQLWDADNPFSAINVGAWAKPAVVDLDGDGRPDLVVGGEDGRLQAWRNTGSGFLRLEGAVDPFDGLDFGWNVRPSFADLDGDGRPELNVLADIPTDIHTSSWELDTWWNTGAGFAFSGPQPINLEYGGNGGFSTTFADVDGDGDPDLVAGTNLGVLNYYRNETILGVPIVVTVTAQDDGAPVVSSSGTASFAENGTGIAYQAVGADPDSRTLSWSLEGTDAARFTIDASTGAVRFVATPNLEAPADADGDNVFDITVVATAADGETGRRDVAITVTDVDERPAITSPGEVSFRENGTGIAYQAAGTDPEGRSLTWQIGGAERNLFAINPLTGAVRFVTPPDYEAPVDGGRDNVYAFDLTAVDPGGNATSRHVRITVTDAHDGPVLGWVDSPVTLAENLVNATPQRLDGDVLFLAPDSGFAGAKLTVSGLLAEDRVSVQHVGTGPNLIGVSGSTVSFGGVEIGSLSGGVGNTFTVTFNGAATARAVETLIEYVTYANASDTPTATRTLLFQFVDAAGDKLPPQRPVFAEQAGAANPFDGIDATDRSMPALADLDGDGDQDLVVGAFDGTLRVWRNEDGVFVARTGDDNPLRGIDVGTVSAPAFADLDGDDDADLVVGAADGTLRAWRNDGGVFTALAGDADRFAGIAVSDVSAPAFVDLDGDGRLDLVLGTGDGTLATWRNTGSGFVALAGQANPLGGIDAGFNSVPAFADLDADGDMDLVLGEASGTLPVWRNDPGGFIELTDSANPFAAIDVDTLSAPTFGDVDGDGDPDLVLGERFGTLLAWRNLAPPGVPITVGITAQNDAPVITSGGTARFAENDTGIAYQAAAADPEDNAFSWSLGGADAARFTIDAATGAVRFRAPPNHEAPGDAGANNVYDILVTATDAGGAARSRAVAITVTDVHEPPRIAGVADSVACAENAVNAAPALLDADVVLTAPDSSFAGGTLMVRGLLAEDRVSISQTGTGAGQIGVADGTVTYGGVAIGNAAGGLGDTFKVTFNAAATVAAMEALIERLAYANASDTPTATRTLTLDLVDAAGARLNAPLALSFAEQAGAANPFDGIDATDRSMPALADLDGDGDQDLVVGAFDGTLRVWRNEDGVFVARTGDDNPLRGIDVGTVSAPAFADLDGDDDADLVVGAADGTLRAWRSDGGVFTALAGDADPFADIGVSDVSAPAFVDLDGDGRLDLVLGTGDGTLATWRNTGSGFVALAGQANPLGGIDAGFNSVPAFADLDADGDMDLVLGEASGTLRVWRNDPGGFVELTGSANPFAAIDVDTLSAPTFGDVDGDGDPDLVLGERFGTLLAWRNLAPPGVPITVEITAQNDAPVITSGGTARFAENDTGIAYQAAAADPEDNAFSWSLGGADAARFTIDAATGAVRFRAPPNHEAPGDAGANNVYDILVTATDPQGASASRAVAITVADVNEAPVIASGGTGSVPEGQGFVVYRATAADPDGDAVVWSLDGADAAHFTIDATTGAVRFRAAPDYEAPADAGADNVYDIVVTATDPDGAGASRAVAITVGNAHDAPQLSGLAAAVSYAENAVNAAPALLDAAVSLFAPDSGFAGGRLTVRGLLAEDRVSISHAGTGAGQIGVAAGTLAYGGTAIGTVAGGVGSALTVTFNAAATVAAVQATIERLAYANVSDTPSLTRVLAIDLMDSAGARLNAPLSPAFAGIDHPISRLGSADRLFAAPALGDLDGDGDADLVAGADDGVLRWWRNDGSAFTALTGAADPLRGAVLDGASSPALVDLDEDGDLDLVVNVTGALRAWRKEGDAFVALTGDAFPFADVSGATGAPAFGDLDGDGDPDMLIALPDGTPSAWRNEGGRFVPMSGPADPFAGVSMGELGTPALVDLDGDGDLDLVAGSSDGSLRAWRNDGSVFTALTGMANPLSGVNVAYASAPAFADLDGDGDADLVVANGDGMLAVWRDISAAGAAITVTVTPEPEGLRLSGSRGNDTLVGGDGNDVLNGGAGADSLVGGPGNDSYVVDDPRDAVLELPRGGIDRVTTSISWTLGAEFEQLVLTGTAGRSGTGNGLANLIVGNAGANLLSGQDGHDTLDGGAGNDTLLGGTGHDRLDGGAGADSMAGGEGDDTYVVDTAGDAILEQPGEGNDRVLASVSWTLGAGLERLSLTGTANLNGTGNALANRLDGNAGTNLLDGGAGHDSLHGGGGADTLAGGTGHDRLDGGAGADELAGGAGSDVFRFTRGEAHGDVVTDFAGNGPALGDRLQFAGYGTAAQGATFVQIEATTWRITSADGHTQEVIVFANAAVLHSSDWSFV